MSGAVRPGWRALVAADVAELKAIVERFFFAPTTGEAAALFRVAFGALVVWYVAAGIGLNLERYYSDAGVLSHDAWVRVADPRWSILGLGPDPLLLRGLWVGTLVSAIALCLGVFPRVAAGLTYVGLASFYNRNPWVMNAGDHLVCTLSFLCMFVPISLKLSPTTWLKTRRMTPAVVAAPVALVFGLALVRLQIMGVYIGSFGHKIAQPAWRRGEAVGLILDSVRFAWKPGGFHDAIERVFTWGTLVIEGAFPLALIKRFRPWILASGVVLHLSIEVLMRIPMFTAVMLVSYLALLDDSEAAWIMRLGRRAKAEPAPTTVGPSGAP